MKKILIIILILILPITVLAAALFSDGFESGDTSGWESETDGENDLSVTTGSKLHGNYGLAALIDNTTAMYVQDTTPATETRYRCRFYFDPNGLNMANGYEIALVETFNDSVDMAFQIRLYYDGSNYKIYALDRADGGYSLGTKYVITNEPHCIELDWKAATGAGNNDGYFTLWIDDIEKGTNSNIDSDTENVHYTRLGANFIDGASTGTYYLDDFASNDDGSKIGLVGENAIFFGMNF